MLKTQTNKLLFVILFLLFHQMLSVHELGISVHHVNHIFQVRDESCNLCIAQFLNTTEFLVLGHQSNPSLDTITLCFHALSLCLALDQHKQDCMVQLNYHVVSFCLHQLLGNSNIPIEKDSMAKMCSLHESTTGSLLTMPKESMNKAEFQTLPPKWGRVSKCTPNLGCIFL